jgi:hypothetical protein
MRYRDKSCRCLCVFVRRFTKDKDKRFVDSDPGFLQISNREEPSALIQAYTAVCVDLE